MNVDERILTDHLDRPDASGARTELLCSSLSRQDAFAGEERGEEGGRRGASRRKAVVIIVTRSDCSSTCELSVRIAANTPTPERP